MPQHRFTMNKEFPRPHDNKLSWSYAPKETPTDLEYTMYPIIRSDEGLGAPGGFYTHPEHASFTQTQTDGCCANSSVFSANVVIELSLSSAFYDDNLAGIKCCFMPIFTSFEDYTAIDDLSQTEIQDVLELQTESTDRQGYPLWNGTDMIPKYTGSSTLPAGMPGLTTDQKLEGVDFNLQTYYDALQYMTISNKLKSVQGGLKWITLSAHKPKYKVLIKLRSKSKKMVPYQLFTCLVGCPYADTPEQLPIKGEMTLGSKYVYADAWFRYNEWNADFYHSSL